MCKNLLEETTQRNLRQKRNSFIRELDQLLDLFPKNFLFSEFLRGILKISAAFLVKF